MRNLNRLGNYSDFLPLLTAAACNTTPDSWALVSGTLYVNRRDRIAVTNANTNLIRSGTSTIQCLNPVNVYIGGVAGNDGFDFEGGNANSVGLFANATPGTTHRALVIKNCSFKYGGGAVDLGTNGLGVNGWEGLVLVVNCRADGNNTDGLNFHNSFAATSMTVITVNCSASDNGRPLQGAAGNYSCNGWTQHENIVGADIAGWYRDGHGGTVNTINNSKMWAFGTLAENDLGDYTWQGTIYPTCSVLADSAQIWCERTKVIMSATGYSYVAHVSTAVIHKKNCWPTPLPDSGLGTIDSFEIGHVTGRGRQQRGHLLVENRDELRRILNRSLTRVTAGGIERDRHHE